MHHRRHRIHRRRLIITILFSVILSFFLCDTAIAVLVDAFCCAAVVPHKNEQKTLTTRKKMTSASTTEIRSTIGDNDCSIDHSSTSPTTNPPKIPQPIKAGFLGFGTIASSIATALATPSHSPLLSKYAGLSLHSISVTKRSESKSSKLKHSFPDIVTVYDSAREVVHNSNLVFLCVLPEQVDAVLSALRKANVWRKEDHTLVSLVVGIQHLTSIVYFVPLSLFLSITMI